MFNKRTIKHKTEGFTCCLLLLECLDNHHLNFYFELKFRLNMEKSNRHPNLVNILQTLNTKNALNE